ncbi:MAG: glucarate dehydratase [Planctomycetaceae bacterium]|nr:glucarate dehydratase [Planctomycetaceae bacterium]
MSLDRREFFTLGSVMVGTSLLPPGLASATVNQPKSSDLIIKSLKVTPIALPDPPILAAGGCHGPYFLRNVIEIETTDGIVGIGETRGGVVNTEQLEKCAEIIVGKSVAAYRSFQADMKDMTTSVYSGIELACLDALGRATNLRLCELMGGPVREEVEFAAYLFYRFAADHPQVFKDSRLVDDRGKGDKALDQWGDVRSADSMAEMAKKFHKKWGFKVMKLKAGVLPPEEELKTMFAMNERFEGKMPLRIDPNGRWTLNTAIRIGRKMEGLPIDYYEDPVVGMVMMAEVRRITGLTMSTNSCVTRLQHIPDALKFQPIDVVLGDHHFWGGLSAYQTLGTICENVGWGLSQHSNNHGGITMAAMIHAGAITPACNYASDTHYVWLVEGADYIKGPNLPIKGGKMSVPKGPGVGVEIDPDKLARAHEVYVKSGVLERNDAETMQRFQPGWKRNLF